MRFMARELEGLLDEARGALGGFVGADPDDLAFVPNATTGVNTVLRWLDLGPGDELLATDHTYNACRNALEAVAARAGARVVVATLPFPAATPERALEAVLSRVSRPDAAGARRPRDEPDGTGPPDRAARARARVARGRRAGRRRPRPRDGPARPPGARRRLLHGELPQVDLRAEGLGVPPRPARPPEGRAAAGDQPRRQLAADGPLDVPARVRLDGHRRPHGLPHRAGGHPLHGVAPARRLAGAHGAQPGHRPGGPRPPGGRPGACPRRRRTR